MKLPAEIRNQIWQEVVRNRVIHLRNSSMPSSEGLHLSRGMRARSGCRRHLGMHLLVREGGVEGREFAPQHTQNWSSSTRGRHRRMLWQKERKRTGDTEFATLHTLNWSGSTRGKHRRTQRARSRFEWNNLANELEGLPRVIYEAT